MNRSILLTLILYGTLNASNPCTKSGFIVTCTDTSLEWQDDNNASDPSKRKNWQNAINHCESLELDGKDDWRLPNINELKSIIDYTRYGPAINSAFKDTATGYYWTSTSFAPSSNGAWGVHFDIGRIHAYNKLSKMLVRCVRQ